MRDTGIGIPTEFLPYVFDTFRQADGSVSRAFGGLGLGLSIVRHLIEMHGGRVTADSAGAGRGSMFTVQLPALAAGKRTPERYGPTPDRCEPLRGRTVLLVDADPDARELARSALERSGAAVVAVETAAAAIDAVNWSRADVLVSDLELAVRHGQELIRNVRQGHVAADIPALALHTGAGPDDRRRALAVGFNALLGKPLTQDAIVTSVCDLLQDPARR